MKAYLLRWMADFGVDGVRMDSVNNVANWDFVQEFKDLARQTWAVERGPPDDRFLVVGRGAVGPARPAPAEPAGRALERGLQADGPQRHPRPQRRRGAELRVVGPEADRLPADRLPATGRRR